MKHLEKVLLPIILKEKKMFEKVFPSVYVSACIIDKRWIFFLMSDRRQLYKIHTKKSLLPLL
jgi:hypothetical protein